MVLLVGYFLYTYFQPECQVCLPGVKCVPCTSKTQQVVLFVGAFVELLLIAKSIVLTDHSPKELS
jgi:hypothetical protein